MDVASTAIILATLGLHIPELATAIVVVATILFMVLVSLSPGPVRVCGMRAVLALAARAVQRARGFARWDFDPSDH